MRNHDLTMKVRVMQSFYVICMIQAYIISINIFNYHFIKAVSRIVKQKKLKFLIKYIFWLVKRFVEPILPTRKTKWLLFSEKLWKSDSIYFNSRRRSQNCFKEFQKWVMPRASSFIIKNHELGKISISTLVMPVFVGTECTISIFQNDAWPNTQNQFRQNVVE